MPEKLKQCFKAVKADLKDRNDSWSPKRVNNVARAICVKRTGQTFVKHSNSINDMFNVSFTESGTVKDIQFRYFAPFKVVEKSKLAEIRADYNIRDPESEIVVGKAIYDTTSTNFNRYEEKELKKAAISLINKPCQADHSESARDTFGKVWEAWWDKGTVPSELAYIAELEGADPLTAKVAKGYVDGVSVAGGARKIECSICGEEWNWMHEHMPGQKYKGEVCERVMKGIYFRHLGFTPFPAIEGADVQTVSAELDDYMPSSLTEAIDNAMAFIELESTNKVAHEKSAIAAPAITIPTFGEKSKMTDDPNALREMQKLEYANAELAKEKADLEEKLATAAKAEADLKEMQDREQARLMQEVIDLELELDKLEESNVNARRSELSNESEISLKSRVDVLKEWLKSRPQDTTAPEAGPKSKLIGFGSKIAEMDDIRKGHYIKESKKEQLAVGLFGTVPSISSVKTLQEWDGVRGRWDNQLPELFRRVPRKS